MTEPVGLILATALAAFTVGLSRGGLPLSAVSLKLVRDARPGW